jgi:hypothetical protein
VVHIASPLGAHAWIETAVRRLALDAAAKNPGMINLIGRSR